MKTATKTILVGVDYTRSSHNAVKYAIHLAEKSGFSITLFHAFDLPIVNTYSGAFFISYRELEVSNLVKLDKYSGNLKADHPKVQIHALTGIQSVKSEILDLLNKRKIYCAVLGLETRSKLSKFIYGSTGVDLAGKVNCPVIIVPQSFNKHKLNRISVAVDNKQSLKSSTVRKVKEIATKFKAPLGYVHVRTPEEIFPEKIKVQGIKMQEIESGDLPSGIELFNKKQRSDMTVVISHSHSWVYRLFNQTHTSVIAVRTKLPVLVIHNEDKGKKR